MKIINVLVRLKEKARGLICGKTKTTKGAPVKNEPYVYVTLKGKKFHYDLLCPGIRKSKEIKMPFSKARKAGYHACDKCCWEYLHK